MGVDAADVDGDGRFDLFVTHLSNEVNDLYRNNGDGTFANATQAAGLGAPSLLYVGWGTAFLDADNDGDPDLYVTNGHVMDDIEAYSDAITYRERDFLFENLGAARFRELGAEAGPFFAETAVGRGMAVVDYDRDGRPDVVLNRNGGGARLLRNVSDTPYSWISLRLVGVKSNRDGIGARIKLTVGGRTQIAERRSGSSYLSGSEDLVHFGLGSASGVAAVEIRWPSGLVEDFEPLKSGRVQTLTEGTGAARAKR